MTVSEKWTLLAFAAVALLAPTTAQAETKGGEVIECNVAKQTISIQTNAGELITIEFTASTMFTLVNGTGRTTPADVHRGDRLLATVKAGGSDGVFLATNVTFFHQPVVAAGAEAAQSQPIEKPLIGALGKKVNLTTASAEQITKAFWDTVLTRCKRPDETSPSLFYLSKHVEDDAGDLTHPRVRSLATLTEYQGDFTYSTPTMVAPSEAERRNTGRVWAATAGFHAPVYRTFNLQYVVFQGTTEVVRGTSFKRPWSPWKDSQAMPTSIADGLAKMIDAFGPGSASRTVDGGLAVTITKDRSGVHFSEEAYDWEPISCEAATAADPFASYPVPVISR